MNYQYCIYDNVTNQILLLNDEWDDLNTNSGIYMDYDNIQIFSKKQDAEERIQALEKLFTKIDPNAELDFDINKVIAGKKWCRIQ